MPRKCEFSSQFFYRIKTFPIINEDFLFFHLINFHFHRGADLRTLLLEFPVVFLSPGAPTKKIPARTPWVLARLGEFGRRMPVIRVFIAVQTMFYETFCHSLCLFLMIRPLLASVALYILIKFPTLTIKMLGHTREGCQIGAVDNFFEIKSKVNAKKQAFLRSVRFAHYVHFGLRPL